MSHFGHKPIPGHAQFAKTTRTAEEARDAFENAGVSISAWAKAYRQRSRLYFEASEMPGLVSHIKLHWLWG
jgi:hypothetical protein